MLFCEGSLKADFSTSTENQKSVIVRLQHAPCFFHLFAAEGKSSGASPTVPCLLTHGVLQIPSLLLTDLTTSEGSILPYYSTDPLAQKNPDLFISCFTQRNTELT